MKPTRTSKGEPQGEGQSEDQRLDHDHAHGQEDGPFPGNPTLLGHNGQRHCVGMLNVDFAAWEKSCEPPEAAITSLLPS